MTRGLRQLFYCCNWWVGLEGIYSRLAVSIMVRTQALQPRASQVYPCAHVQKYPARPLVWRSLPISPRPIIRVKWAGYARPWSGLGTRAFPVLRGPLLHAHAQNVTVCGRLSAQLHSACNNGPHTYKRGRPGFRGYH